MAREFTEAAVAVVAEFIYETRRHYVQSLRLDLVKRTFDDQTARGVHTVISFSSPWCLQNSYQAYLKEHAVAFLTELDRLGILNDSAKLR
jgi:hypothetical protein